MRAGLGTDVLVAQRASSGLYASAGARPAVAERSVGPPPPIACQRWDARADVGASGPHPLDGARPAASRLAGGPGGTDIFAAVRLGKRAPGLSIRVLFSAVVFDP